MALRLGHRFKASLQFWMDLQPQFDLAEAHWLNGTAVRRLPTKDSPAGAS